MPITYTITSNSCQLANKIKKEYANAILLENLQLT